MWLWCLILIFLFFWICLAHLILFLNDPRYYSRAFVFDFVVASWKRLAWVGLLDGIALIPGILHNALNKEFYNLDSFTSHPLKIWASLTTITWYNCRMGNLWHQPRSVKQYVGFCLFASFFLDFLDCPLVITACMGYLCLRGAGRAFSFSLFPCPATSCMPTCFAIWLVDIGQIILNYWKKYTFEPLVLLWAQTYPSPKNVLAALSNALSLRRFIPGGVDSDRSTSFKRERAGHNYRSKWIRNTPRYLHQKAPRLLFRPHIGENRPPRHLFLLKSIRHRRKTVSMDMASAVKQ